MSTSRTIALLSIGLTLSLCLNGFFVGTRVARYQMGLKGPPPVHAVDEHPEARPDGGADNFREGPNRDRMRMIMKKFLERIPEEDKGVLQQAMDEARPLIEERMKAVEVARTSALEIMKAEPLDSVRLRDALAVQRVAQSDVQATVHDTIVKALEKMTPEQRARISALAKRLFL